MVPGQLEDRRQALSLLVGRRVGAVDDLRFLAGKQYGERIHGVRRDHEEDHRLVSPQELLVAKEIVVGHRCGDRGDLLEEQAVAIGEMVGELDRAHVVFGRDNDVDPVIGGVERDLDLGDDAVGAVGMHHLVELPAGQLEDPRTLLHGDDAQPKHVADVAKAAPVDRADAAGAAGDEAGDRGSRPGRGVEAELLLALAGLAVDLSEDRARLGHRPAAGDRLQRIEIGEAEDHSARQRHRLAVIAGAGAAGRDRHPQRVAGLEDADHLGLVLRRDDEIAGDVIELALQHRRVPEEVPALMLHDRRVVLGLDAVEGGFQAGDVGHGEVLANTRCETLTVIPAQAGTQ